MFADRMIDRYNDCVEIKQRGNFISFLFWSHTNDILELLAFATNHKHIYNFDWIDLSELKSLQVCGEWWVCVFILFI